MVGFEVGFKVGSLDGINVGVIVGDFDGNNVGFDAHNEGSTNSQTFDTSPVQAQK